MKKIILAASMIVCLGFCATAQSDGLFNNWDDFDNLRDGYELPTLPSQHGYNYDQEAPIGSGLLILTILGTGYAVARKVKNEE